MEKTMELAVDPTRFDRTQEAYQQLGITKDIWCEKTGFSEDQYYRWHNLEHTSTPSARQICHMCEALDINPIYLWYGFGTVTLSESRAIWERGVEAWMKLIDYILSNEFQNDRDSRDELYKAVYELRNEVYHNIDRVKDIHEMYVNSLTTHEENWAMVRDLSIKVDTLLLRTKKRYDTGEED